MNEDKGKLTSELTDRLDDLFSEEDDSNAPEQQGQPEEQFSEDQTSTTRRTAGLPPSGKESPLIELDAIVLSLDWEITDENLDKLLNEIERLKAIYKDARLPYMFLQLHGSVGKYIASKKVDAHPDSIKLLHSVHAGLEKILTNSEINELDKKKILSEEVKKFKGLKHQIMLSKSMEPEILEAAPSRKTLAPATPAQPPATRHRGGITDPDTQTFLDEIKQLIKEEFKELKNEIKSWKQDLE